MWSQKQRVVVPFYSVSQIMRMEIQWEMAAASILAPWQLVRADRALITSGHEPPFTVAIREKPGLCLLILGTSVKEAVTTTKGVVFYVTC